MIKKILPRIVVVDVQALLHIHCASLQHLVRRHPRGLWQSYQPRGPIDPLKINFSFMTYKNILTQNRFWRSTDKALYALCQFSLFSPRRPLATLPAAWANAPYKNQFSRSWLFKKILPRIVFVFPQAYFQIVPLVSQIRHRRNDWWRHEQHWQPIHAKKNLYR